MKLAIMQPYLFPYIGYFQLMAAVDRFVLLDTVAYINRGWINRNRIIVNGVEHLMTVPLQKASQNRLIKDIRIAECPPWRERLLKTLFHSYHRAPQFSVIYPLLESLVHLAEPRIAGLVHQSLVRINDYLGIRTEVVPSAAHYGNDGLRSADKLLDICGKERATVYINPAGGRDLYDSETFSRRGVTLRFLRCAAQPYSQATDRFIPDLSIIDVLMRRSRAEISDMLGQYELI